MGTSDEGGLGIWQDILKWLCTWTEGTGFERGNFGKDKRRYWIALTQRTLERHHHMFHDLYATLFMTKRYELMIYTAFTLKPTRVVTSFLSLSPQLISSHLSHLHISPTYLPISFPPQSPPIHPIQKPGPLRESVSSPQLTTPSHSPSTQHSQHPTQPVLSRKKKIIAQTSPTQRNTTSSVSQKR